MIVFDVEANGLLDQATKIHCLSYTSDGKDYKTIFDYSDMRDLLLSQHGLVGHNIVRYDVPLIEKILGIKLKARLFDTLPMSWVLNLNRLSMVWNHLVKTSVFLNLRLLIGTI